MFFKKKKCYRLMVCSANSDAIIWQEDYCGRIETFRRYKELQPDECIYIKLLKVFEDGTTKLIRRNPVFN